MKIEEIINDKEVISKLSKDGIIEATKVQEKAIPIITKGKDSIIQSETGSGKTLVFVLSIVENIDRKGLRALIVVPTRELAKQITHVFLKYTNLKTVSIYGGVPTNMQKLEEANVAVGTPGRLIDLLNKGKLVLNNIQFFILDEADRMLDMGFITDIEKIIEACNKERQTVFFSATVSKEVLRIGNKYMKQPEKVFIERSITKAKHKYYVVSANEKFSLLLNLLKSNNSHSLVFCATKKTVKNVAKQLRKNDIKAGAIHGYLNQRQRENVLNKFRKKWINVLVATDVAARGLDIKGITHIYNFDIPNGVDMYIHRAGRTARMGSEGKIISFVRQKEYLKYMEIIHSVSK